MRKYIVRSLGGVLGGFVFETTYKDVREADEIKAALARALGYYDGVNIKNIRPKNTKPYGLFVEIDQPDSIHLDLIQVPNDTAITELRELTVETVYVNKYYSAYGISPQLAIDFLKEKVSSRKVLPLTDKEPEYRVMLTDQAGLEPSENAIKAVHEKIQKGTENAIRTAISNSANETMYLVTIAQVYLLLREAQTFLQVKIEESDLAHKECQIEISQAMGNIRGKYSSAPNYIEKGKRAEEFLDARQKIEAKHYARLAKVAAEAKDQQERVKEIEQKLGKVELNYSEFLLSIHGEPDE